MRIENWSVVSFCHHPYSAPETCQLSLHGCVFGHPRFEDGTPITTSPIISVDGAGHILTRSGSDYFLGKVDPLYERAFPEAQNRLLNSLRQ